jgi:hypothetical protein
MPDEILSHFKPLEVIQVIHTRLQNRGKGLANDPVRTIDQYWDMQGNLLWERDMWLEVFQKEVQK